MLLSQAGQSVVVHAPAKLNLFLEVLGTRSDGYHELETLMVSVGLYDTLRFREESSRQVQLRCFHSGRCAGPNAAEADRVPVGGNNLAVRAACLLRDYAGVDRGVRIDLVKRIPVAAGLAGGSSDAAAVLVALRRLWGLKLTTGELQQLASQLGSDVGFFLAPSPIAICRGRGEEVEPLNLPLRLHFVIARPSTGLSTAAVYSQCRPTGAPRSVDPLVACLRTGQLHLAARHLYNTLQAPAEQLNAEVTYLKRLFSQHPVLGHMMSGSGTAYFGVCANQRQAQWVAARLKAMCVGSVYVVRSRP